MGCSLRWARGSRSESFAEPFTETIVPVHPMGIWKSGSCTGRYHGVGVAEGSKELSRFENKPRFAHLQNDGVGTERHPPHQSPGRTEETCTRLHPPSSAGGSPKHLGFCISCEPALGLSCASLGASSGPW